MKRVILFSGGRTSGYMLRRLMDSPNGIDDCVIIFCNTGKERKETLDFVHRVQTNWYVPIVWIEYHRVNARDIPVGVFPTERRNQNLAKSAQNNETTHWFREVSYLSASRDGEPFDELIEWMSVLPNVVSRVCSVQLKMRSAMRYLFSQGIKEYSPIIGIRKDEDQRAVQILATCDSFEHPEFPLIQMGVTEHEVMDFWKHHQFDLQLDSYEGNCDLCFLKAKWKRIKLVRENPGMVNWWKGWEGKKQCTGNGNRFRIGESYKDIEIIANQPRQQELFVSTKDIPCSCAERGFERDEEE